MKPAGDVRTSYSHRAFIYRGLDVESSEPTPFAERIPDLTAREWSGIEQAGRIVRERVWSE